MKLYRVQANYKNIYIDETLEAKNDIEALECFKKKVDSGDFKQLEGAGFLDPNFLFITFEEVDRDEPTKVNIGETSIGVSVGNESVGTGQSNS